MGLHTTFVGHVTIEPPLSDREVRVVRGLNRTRRWDAPGGALRIAEHPSDDDPPPDDRGAHGRPAPGAPGLWCPWTACQDGHCLHWDGVEKPYEGERWLRWTIDTLLRPGAEVAGGAWARRHGLTCDHVLDGIVVGERTETLELFVLGVSGNEVSHQVLLPGAPGVNRWGERPPGAERQHRSAQLAARARRYADALVQDRARPEP